MRILDDALWRTAKARQEELSAKYATVVEAVRSAHANRLNGTHRPRHLLSGLLECGSCGGPHAMRGQNYGCSRHIMTGTCTNGRGIRRIEIEERVLAGLKDRLPRSRRRSRRSSRRSKDGAYSRALGDLLHKLEAREDELCERLAARPADIPDMHPNIAAIYRRKVERLSEASKRPQERDEAAEAIPMAVWCASPTYRRGAVLS